MILIKAMGKKQMGNLHNPKLNTTITNGDLYSNYKNDELFSNQRQNLQTLSGAGNDYTYRNREKQNQNEIDDLNPFQLYNNPQSNLIPENESEFSQFVTHYPETDSNMGDRYNTNEQDIRNRRMHAYKMMRKNAKIKYYNDNGKRKITISEKLKRLIPLGGMLGICALTAGIGYMAKHSGNIASPVPASYGETRALEKKLLMDGNVDNMKKDIVGALRYIRDNPLTKYFWG
tara:strand:+ start:5005 stop:5697 length:693 start_codon:yes stop_codon:yes gene_type:complete